MTRPPLDGLLLLDKPVGPTSHDLVDQARQILGQRRVGHTGTLDPAASGLLPLVIGRATRLARFLPQSPKRYEGRLELGLATTTDDLAGQVVRRHTGPLPSAEQVLELAERFRGRVLQVPPSVSARKVQGRRLYRLAREGRTVVAPAVETEIFRFELRPTEDAAQWSFVAEVGSGAYIRALARDLGVKLGCGGVLVSLRRLAIGPMDVSAASSLTDFDSADVERLRSAVVPLEAMPLEPPAVHLTEDAMVRRFMAGADVRAPAGVAARGVFRVFDLGGALLGIGETLEGSLHARVVLPPPAETS